MRRVLGIPVALLLCVSLLTPLASALLITPSPACCMQSKAADGSMAHCARHQHVSSTAGSGTAGSGVDGFGSLAQKPCQGCCSCFGPVVSHHTKARPITSAIAPVPTASHTLLGELDRTESSNRKFRQNAERAPPLL